MSLNVAPRRHSKSTVFSLIVLFLFTSRKNHVTMLLGNSELHSMRTQKNLLQKIITATPLLAQAIPAETFRKFEIRFPALGNAIQLSPSNVSVSFGDRINTLWVSDYHACPDLGPFNALQAATLDSEDSLIFIDSNVSHHDGPEAALQNEAEHDPTIFCKYTSYRDFDDFAANAPLWIDRGRAKRLKKTTLLVDWKRDILGQRSSATNALFPEAVIDRCRDTYKIPILDPREIAGNRKYKISGALDRAKNLFQTKWSDATVWTTIMKMSSPKHGEPEIYILNQKKINPNTARAIKKVITKDHERFHLDNVVLENYETADLAPWLADQRIPFELISAHDTAQNQSFPELFRIANEGRLHIPVSCEDLISEMRTFCYTQRAGSKYSFGHSSQRYHDDFVFSLNWAIFALRASILSAYTIGNFQCSNRSPRRQHCFLMGGNLELACKYQCYAYERVHTMQEEYSEMQLDTDLSIQDFFYTHVKRAGAVVSQAV